MDEISCFYDVLADYYDEIFPLDPDAVALVKKNAQGNRATTALILDVGCATGSLANELARSGYSVTGIDLDEKMIAIADSRAQGKNKADFRVGDMLSIEKALEGSRFNCIVCFGNTLVHLPDEAAVQSFFEQSRRLLRPGGKLLFQVLNYNRILDGKVSILPDLETASLTFHRRYSPRIDGRLDFITELTIKKSGEILSNSLPLIPLRKHELEVIFSAAGFSEIRYYGGFQRNLYEETGMLLVGEAWK